MNVSFELEATIGSIFLVDFSRGYPLLPEIRSSRCLATNADVHAMGMVGMEVRWFSHHLLSNRCINHRAGGDGRTSHTGRKKADVTVWDLMSRKMTTMKECEPWWSGGWLFTLEVLWTRVYLLDRLWWNRASWKMWDVALSSSFFLYIDVSTIDLLMQMFGDCVCVRARSSAYENTYINARELFNSI